MRSRVALALVTTSLWTVSLPAVAGQKTFTTDADFDTGVLFNVNHSAPNNDQLQLNQQVTTFPVLWAANAGEDTVSKIDTNLNKEIGRYRTWFTPVAIHGAFAGPAPSRTAVDQNGDVYVANRHFDGRQAMVLKILTSGFIDRNGNGVADTSSDGNNDGTISGAEILPVVDDNANGIPECSAASCEFRDERIVWASLVGPTNGLGRSLCIGNDQTLWVGLYNARQYWNIQSTNGSVISGPHAVSWTPYGCAVDSSGILWSASLSAILGRLDTANPANTAAFGASFANYGIALGGPGDNAVYLGQTSSPPIGRFDKGTNTFTYLGAALGFATTGIAVDSNGDIFVGHFPSGAAGKVRPSTNTVLWSSPTQSSSESRGPVADSAGNAWMIHRLTDRLSKFAGSNGAALGTIAVGDDPYTYSDATGLGNLISNPIGTWAVVYDGSIAGLNWSSIAWTESVPTNTSISVRVRADDNAGNLALLPFVPVTNASDPPATGRYIEVEVRFAGDIVGGVPVSPILFDLSIAAPNPVCYVDGDTDVDRLDINAIFAARNTAAQPGDPRDFDQNGFITVNDGRACTLRCTRPNCAQ
jgi:hypothetical protein